jgi:hypothetical protein
MVGGVEIVMTKNQILIRLSESENTQFAKVDFPRQPLPQKEFEKAEQM